MHFAAAFWLASTAYPAEAERSTLAAATAALAVASGVPAVWGAGAADHTAERPARWAFRLAVAAPLAAGVIAATLAVLHFHAALGPVSLVAGVAALSWLTGLALRRRAGGFAHGAAARDGVRSTIDAAAIVVAAPLAAMLLAMPRLAHDARRGDLRLLARVPDGLVLGLGAAALAYVVAAALAAAGSLRLGTSARPLGPRRSDPAPRIVDADDALRPAALEPFVGAATGALLAAYTFLVRGASAGTAAHGGRGLERTLALVVAAGAVGVLAGHRVAPGVGATARARGACAYLAASGAAVAVFGLARSPTVIVGAAWVAGFAASRGAAQATFGGASWTWLAGFAAGAAGCAVWPGGTPVAAMGAALSLASGVAWLKIRRGAD